LEQLFGLRTCTVIIVQVCEKGSRVIEIMGGYMWTENLEFTTEAWVRKLREESG
jgi:hypothetical protein